jgi:cell division protein FtsI/penicillin-binding protein 2
MQRITGVDETRRLICAQSNNFAYFADSTNSLRPHDEKHSLFLVGLLNSKLLNWRFSLTSTNNNVGTNEIEMLPYPRQLSERQVDEIATVVKELQGIDTKEEQLSSRPFSRLNELIYKLFDISQEDIALVENSFLG